ncbi:ParB/RepB/Spo0J family partition protein [Streptomyces sp. SPB074]|uniref:ParB/RepB/Spo0J family partition protein n=1 Tax=Streptomyces sp. (strain SPB074) TaxID=465543 RepID=UPI00017F1649|nr:ParB/RepB/Spo0J family partition protein [Streptomyces sp. SPB074]EDY46146.1 plasmid partitioning protein, ParB2 [Streptomyces sp. SPB074]
MTSKADTLGSAPAFGTARSARSSRRAAIDRTINGDDAASTHVTELPVTLVSDNPDNPRNHLRNLEEIVETVREVGIILPIVIATTDAYLKDRADRVTDLDAGSQYVVVDGHRRLEAARRVGLATIPVRVDNARVTTDEALLESAFIANYHRDDMTDLEEANALKQLVDYYGSQTKAAKRLGLPQSTISSKLSLLKLSPELQKDLATGARKSEHVRNLGKLSPTEQKRKADERAAASPEVAQPGQLSRRDNPEPFSTPGGQPQVPAPAEQGQLSRRDNPKPRSSAAPPQVAPPLEEERTVAAPRPSAALPRQHGETLMNAAFEELTADQRSAFILHYFQRSTGVDAVIADMRGDLDVPARESLARILQQVAAGLLRDA